MHRFSVLNDDWQVNGDRFVSQSQEGNQRLIFAEFVKNGWISADITPLKGAPLRREEGTSVEASLMFRYRAPDAYYYAGVGAFRTKFFVGKAIPGPIFLSSTSVGTSQSVRYNQTYQLRVEFNGNQIKVFENDVQQLLVLDEQFQRGQLGLATWKCQARFDNVRYGTSQPVAFVVMPFSTELSFVYQMIKGTAEAYGMRVIRADETFISRPVMEEVKKQIAEADLIFVDFTGRNPNVYYEAGLAEAWKKDWIILAQSSDDMTFDVRHIGSIRYTNTMGADKKLREELEAAIEALGYRKPIAFAEPTLTSGVSPGRPRSIAESTAERNETKRRRERKRSSKATTE